MKQTQVRDYDLLVIGECYVEFRCDGDICLSDSYEKDIGGADAVVAAAAARLGSGVSFISAVARDPFGAFIRERLLAQGINIDHIVTSGGYNGIYIASSRFPEQREYLFHRPGSAANEIIPSMIYDDLIDNCKIVYASSELQSVSRPARHTIFKAMETAHRNKTMVAYDPNLRLQRWSLDESKEALWSILPFVDVIFPSAPDESKALFGYERPTDVVGFLWDRNVQIVVVKTGPGGCVVGYDGKVEEFPQTETHEAFRSVTLIGSAFIGAFLHYIARGHDPFESAGFANAAALFKGTQGGGLDSLPTVNDLKI